MMDEFEKEIKIFKANAIILSERLVQVINSPALSYKQICTIEKQGLYVIYNENEILYIGKTNRTGKVRMQELAADFRSHTFNRKLLSRKFKDLGFVFEVLKKETKREWIEKGLITKKDFKAHQKEINQYIKQNLSFKFFPLKDERKLISLEHFAIAVLTPALNDYVMPAIV